MNFLLVYRFSPLEAEKKADLWGKLQLKAGPLGYLKLYFSHISDEAYYYEWSSLALGKGVEPEYRQWRLKAPGSQEGEEETNEIKKSFLKNPRVLPPPAADPQSRSPLQKYPEEIRTPRMPYRDIEFEYPPFLMLPLLAARELSQTYIGYTHILAFLISLAYLASLYLTYRIWQKIPSPQKLTWPQILFFSAAALLCLGQLYVTRLDVFPGLLILLALHAFLKERYSLSVFWIFVGTFTKIYPLLLAPLFALRLFQNKKYHEIIKGAVLFILLSVGFNVFLGWITEGYYWDSYRYQAGRGIQIESLYALVPYLSYLIFHAPITIYNSHHSTHIAMNHGGWLLKISAFLPLIVFAWIYLRFYEEIKKNLFDRKDPSFLVTAVLLLVFTFILTFKILSPQFLIWLTPLIFLSVPKKKYLFLLAFLISLVITQLICPNFYFLLQVAHPLGIALLSIRNLLLILLFIWIFYDWKKRGMSPMEK